MSTVELEITLGNSLENINEEILGPSDQVHNPGPGYLEAFVLNVHGIIVLYLRTSKLTVHPIFTVGFTFCFCDTDAMC